MPDGTIVAVGTSFTGTGGFEDTMIARFNSNGSLDTTFASGGRAVMDLSGGGVHDEATSVRIQPLAGDFFRIVATGYAEIVDASNPNGRRPILNVEAFTPSGTLDSTFGTGGIVKTEAPPVDSGVGQVKYWWGNSLAIQNDGKIVVSASGRTTNFTSQTGFGLARYTADGVLDVSFAANGMSFIDQLNGTSIAASSPNDVALDSSGRIVVAGQTNDPNPGEWRGLDFVIARYTSDDAQAPLTGSQTVANDLALLSLLADESPTPSKRK